MGHVRGILKATRGRQRGTGDGGTSADHVDGGPRVAALLLCSPHNPTGHVFSTAELQKLGDFCERYDLLLCSDEIHADLLLEEGAVHVPAGKIPALADRTVTLFAASKTFNVPSLCAAFAIIPNLKIRLRFKKEMQGLITEVPCLGLTATEAAFNEGEPWRLALIEQVRTRPTQLISLTNTVFWY